MSPFDPETFAINLADPARLAIFVHEYWHYLQNLTTVAGFMSLVLQQDFVAAFSQTLHVTGDGRSIGSDAISADLTNHVRELRALFQARNGDDRVPGINQREMIDFRITSVDEDEYELTRVGRSVPLRRIVLNIDAEMNDGSHQLGQLRFGQLCVEEGVAYLVDRMVASAGHGVAGDDAPFFPYRVLRVLALTGSAIDMSPIEIAALGTLSLMTPDPAGVFLELRDGYVHYRQEGRSILEALDAVWQDMREDIERIVRIIIDHDLSDLVSRQHDRGLIEHAFRWLAEKYESLLQRRLEDPFFDLRPFTHNAIQLHDLVTLLRNVVCCDVFIERAGIVHDIERDRIIAFGTPGISNNGASVSDYLRTLEAQNNYAISHIGRNSIVDSDTVEHYLAAQPEDRTRPCPFYRSCGLALRRESGEICFRRPWRIYNPGQLHCWYGAAVICTVGTTQGVNVIQDPRQLALEYEHLTQAVRLRAHELWEESGRTDGHDVTDWMTARAELGIAEEYHI